MSPAFRGAIALALLGLAAGSHSAQAQGTDYSTTVIDPFFTNVANFATTTDTSSPTFNRPAIVLGGVTPAPLTPSGIGTNVGYAVGSFTPTEDNQYRVTTTINSGYAANDAAGTSNLVQVLYQGAFDPTDKTFANAQLAFNPPGTSGSYFTGLTGGQAYNFVDGGRYNIGNTGSQLSLGTVTTNIDEYHGGTLTAVSQADTLGRPGIASQTLTLFGGGAVTGFNSFDIVGLNQVYLGGLTATLTHDGVSVNIFDRPGAAASNYYQGTSANFDGGDYYFTGGGTDLLTAATAAEPPDGSYADSQALASGAANPYLSFDSLTAFDGLGLSGDWTLSVKDSDAGNNGSFLGFSFNASGIPASPVPEASTWISMGLGCLTLGGMMIAKRRRAAAAV